MTRRRTEHRAYFEAQLIENDGFFARFGSEPDWMGKTVLDFGCGHGALSARAAAGGAARAVGVDIHDERIKWAQENVVGDNVEFVNADVATLAGSFDLILTKDTLEHVDDVPAVLSELRRLLADGGEIWAGFSPLYYSPFGDHGRLRLRVPWLHALPWPLTRFLARNIAETQPLRELTDVDLNGLTPAQFRQAVTASGLRITRIRYNAGDKRLLRVLSSLRRVPPLERFATVSIYALLSHAHPATRSRPR